MHASHSLNSNMTHQMGATWSAFIPPHIFHNNVRLIEISYNFYANCWKTVAEMMGETRERKITNFELTYKFRKFDKKCLNKMWHCTVSFKFFIQTSTHIQRAQNVVARWVWEFYRSSVPTISIFITVMVCHFLQGIKSVWNDFLFCQQYTRMYKCEWVCVCV